MANIEITSKNFELRKRLIADLILLATAGIWGFAFVAQRIAAQEVGTLVFNGVRFIIGALVLLPFIIFLKPDRDQAVDHRESKKRMLGLILAGILLFGGSGLQQAGLQYTSAGNAGFVTGLYIVLIPIFLAVFLKRKPGGIIWLAALASLSGLFLLSTGGTIKVNRGDGLELIGAVFWACHVILVGWMVHRMDILRFAAGQYLICGFISLGFGLLFEQQGLEPILKHWWVVAYTGVVSVGMAYTLQAFGQRVAPPADAAIILSMEAVFAAISGWIFLQETLTPVQITGCLVMFSGMLMAQSDIILKKRGFEIRGAK